VAHLLTTSEINQEKNQIVIFVENALYVSGISRILKDSLNNILEVEYEVVYTSDNEDATFICNIKPYEMEKKAQQLLLRNPSTNIILIKDHFTFDEVNRLIHIGVKGVCLTDIDTIYLINTIKQVQNGYVFIDHRFIQSILQENIYLKENQNNIPIDDTEMKALLTNREIEILSLLVKGLTNNQIGNKLEISHKTVKTHIFNIFNKLEVQDRLNAVLKVIKKGWIPLA
jgi:two-component system, NarL family, response regulator DegU